MALRHLQLFEAELQLLDAMAYLLAARSEQHVAQLRNQQLQMFDLTGPRLQREDMLFLLQEDERLQRRRIESFQIRQRERFDHARSMPRK